MTTINEVAVKLGLNSDDFMKNVDKVEQECKELEHELNETKESFEKMSKAMAGTEKPSKEMVDVFNNLKRTLKDEQNAFNNFQGNLKKFEGGLTKSTGSVNLLQGALGKLVAGGTILLLGKQLLNFSQQSVEAFREQDRAIKSLNSALQNAGVYTDEYARHLKNLSSEIQSYSNFGDEAVEKAIALGQAYSGNIKLSDDLIKSTVDFAAATETDLQTAFTLVGKSIGTSTNALSRYGVALDDSMTKEEKMAAITQTLQQRFDGSAKAMSDSSTKLKNDIGDLSEAFGKWLNPAVEKTQETLRKAAVRLTEWINKIRILHSEIQKLDMDESQTRYKQTATILKQLDAKMAKRGGGMETLSINDRDKYKKAVKDLTEVEGHIDSLRRKQKQLEKDSQNTFQAFSDKNNTAITKTIEKNKKVVQENKKLIDEYQKIKDRISKYKQDVSDSNISSQYGEAGAFLGGLSSEYKAKLDLEIWYQQERARIIEESNNNIELQNEAFSQLDNLKTAKMAEANLQNWQQYGQAVSNIMSQTFTNLLTGQQKFGDAMKSLASNMLSQLLQMLIQYILKETALRAMSWLAGAGGGGGFMSAISSGLGLIKHHSGGMIPGTKEQLAVLQGGERVLSRSEAQDYNNGESSNDSGANNIMLFNIKAWDGKDVIQTLKANSNTINQIVSSGIKNNNQGLRTTVQNI